MDLCGEMDNMREENVTKKIIKYLKKNNWEIIAYDFPQSGTGIMILPDNNKSTKNKDSIIPDIVAYKNKVCIFFENKNRLVKSDFDKVNNLIQNNRYINNINKFLSQYDVTNIYYGIGLPYDVRINSILEYSQLVDFVLKVSEDESVEIVTDKYNIFYVDGLYGREYKSDKRI